MNKNIANVIGLVIVVIGIVFGVGLAVKAMNDSVNVSGDWNQYYGNQENVEQEMIGAAPGNMLAEDYDPYVRYNSGYNSAKSITTSDTITGGTVTDGTASISSGAISGLTTINASGDITTTGDDFSLGTLNTKVVTGSCADATTTPIAIAMPYSSGTTTVTGLYVTQPNTSTTTVSWDCGVAANQFTSSDTLIDGQSISTTTWGNLSHDTGTNGRATDIQGSVEYLTCTLTPDIADGVTNAANTFTCTYKATFVQ